MHADILVAQFVVFECLRPNGDKTAYITLISADLLVIFQDVVDHGLPFFCFESTDITFPGTSVARNSSMVLLLVITQQFGKLR